MANNGRPFGRLTFFIVIYIKSSSRPFWTRLNKYEYVCEVWSGVNKG